MSGTSVTHKLLTYFLFRPELGPLKRVVSYKPPHVSIKTDRVIVDHPFSFLQNVLCRMLHILFLTGSGFTVVTVPTLQDDMSVRFVPT